jgi:hypothetical protein
MSEESNSVMVRSGEGEVDFPQRAKGQRKTDRIIRRHFFMIIPSKIYCPKTTFYDGCYFLETLYWDNQFRLFANTLINSKTGYMNFIEIASTNKKVID